MIIAYFSNFLNHHQKLVADELASTEGIDYIFVETVPMYDWLKKGGYTDYSQVSYVLRAWENEENRQKAIELAKTADVALFGGPEVLYLEVIRAKNTDKISFEVSERWLKRGWLNLLSPRLIKSLCYYRILFWRKPFYKLCASAFGASDQYKLHTYKNRCYKWGYFTTVDKNFDVKASQNVRSSETTSLMWCSRFLKWKHPELPILMAKRNYPVKGHPDFVFLKWRVAVFVDGCFWHGHDCRNTYPATNKEFWQKKRDRNIKHDQEITELFENRGWTVVRIWECELKRKNYESALQRITDHLP